MKILSPMPTGCGAYVLHEQLAQSIDGYQLRPYSPWSTLFPPVLPFAAWGKADIVHTGVDYGIFFKRPGVPLVTTIHGYVSDAFMRPYCSRLQYLHYRTDLRSFVRATLKLADQTVAASQFMIDLIKRDLGVQSSIRLIYNGIDHHRFRPEIRPTRFRTGPVRVLFCGNLRRAKGADLLVPLANALGERYEIRYTGGLRRSAAPGGSLILGAASLKNLGQIRHADMPAVYADVDMLLMPSVREGFGLCVAEAMACGLPVVACGASALAELVVDRQGGFLCDKDELDCYLSAIKTVAENPNDGREMGAFNRARVEQHFTLERMVREYRDLFEAVRDFAVNR